MNGKLRLLFCMHAFSSATEGELLYLRYPIPEMRDRLSNKYVR
jgi:hypothetical protein